MPARIQRRRVRGWRKPDNCVIVSRPSRFGNPFAIRRDEFGLAVEHPDGSLMTGFTSMENAREVAVAYYRSWLADVGPEVYEVGGRAYGRRRVLADLHLLRGKDLACTCPLPEPGEPDHCHAAVLLELAARAEAVSE